VPDYVTVNAYASVATETGTPRGAPIATFECARLSEPRCTIAPSNEGLIVQGLSSSLLSVGFLTVFCIWHVPLAEQHATTDLPDLSASWLFDFDSGREREASLP